MDLAQRIAQFENMAHADPDNEMAHFSLGGAYAQAERHADAAASYLRCTVINPNMSKAWQLAAESLRKAGDTGRAITTATQGYEIASAKGDLMPKTAMATLLKELGAPVPETKSAATSSAATPASDGTTFICRQSGRPGTRMDRPPFKGPVGQWIHDYITSETWRAWIAQGTKVINELRLDLSRDPDAETYDRHMREYLGIDDEMHDKLRRG